MLGQGDQITWLWIIMVGWVSDHIVEIDVGQGIRAHG